VVTHVRMCLFVGHAMSWSIVTHQHYGVSLASIVAACPTVTCHVWKRAGDRSDW